MLKELRKALDRKDPLTIEWFATDARARLDFMLYAFLRQVMPGINTMRHIRRSMEELRACGGEVIDEVPPESPAPSGNRLLPG